MEEREKHMYPVGRFETPEKVSSQDIDENIKIIKDFPQKLKDLVKNLTDDQLDVPYREGGWKIRQLIHHIADSHMNSYIRFKLALTEDNPVIKCFDQNEWAELQDSFSMDINASLQILKGVHKRWVYEMKCLTNKEFNHTFYHPEHKKTITLRESLAMYAWHCSHHFAHIQNCIERKGW